MQPTDPIAVDLELESGRPARASLHLGAGLRLTGFFVWRTPRGPRVVFPEGADRRGRPVLEVPPSVRRGWSEAILACWRRDIAELRTAFETAPRRRVA